MQKTLPGIHLLPLQFAFHSRHKSVYDSSLVKRILHSEKLDHLICDSCWRNEVSNFRLRQSGKVVPFCEHYGPDVDINTENSSDNSGSKETMQKVLALFGGFFKTILGVKNSEDFNFCVFHPIWVKFVMT